MAGHSLFGGAYTTTDVRRKATNKVRAENRSVVDGDLADAIDAGMEKLLVYWLPMYEQDYTQSDKQGFNYAVRCVSQMAGVWLVRENKRRRKLVRAFADPATRYQLDWCSTGEDEQPPAERRDECPHMALVRELVPLLPERQRTVVEALYWWEWSLAAVADELGVSPTTVSRDRQAALSRLRGEVPAPSVPCPVCRCWGSE